jgi:hypothetical protein
MGETMAELAETVQKLAKTGQFAPAWFSQFKILSVPEQQKLIEQAQRTPPLTYTPITLEQKNLLRSYMSQDLLEGLTVADLKSMTFLEAEFFIQCGKNKCWCGNTSLQEHYKQTDLDTSPATPEQLDAIIELSKDKLLRPFSMEALLKLCNLSARMLIWKGEMLKRKRGKKCS